MAQDPPSDVESGGGGEPHGPLYDKRHQFAQHELPPETPELVDPALRVMRDTLQTQIIPHVGGKVGTAPLILAAFARRLIVRVTRSCWSPSRISSSCASCGRASASLPSEFACRAAVTRAASLRRYDGKRAGALHGAYWRFRVKHFGAAPLACAAHARARDALRTGFVELPLGARDRDGRQLIVIRPARIDAEALKSAPLAEAVWSARATRRALFRSLPLVTRRRSTPRRYVVERAIAASDATQRQGASELRVALGTGRRMTRALA